MHNRLSKYFSGKYPNSEKINISDFVKILGNIDIEGDFISKYGAKHGAIRKDYENLFETIYNSPYGKNKIKAISKYFGLSEWFIKF